MTTYGTLGWPPTVMPTPSAHRILNRHTPSPHLESRANEASFRIPRSCRSNSGDLHSKLGICIWIWVGGYPRRSPDRYRWLGANGAGPRDSLGRIQLSRASGWSPNVF